MKMASLSYLMVSLGGLVLFLVLGSLLLVPYPIGTTIHTYFDDTVNSSKLVLTTGNGDQTLIEGHQEINAHVTPDNSLSGSNLETPVSSSGVNGTADVTDKNLQSVISLQVAANDTREENKEKARTNSVIPSIDVKRTLPGDSGIADRKSDDSNRATSPRTKPTISAVTGDEIKTMSDDSGCDLYHGSWFYDPSGPLYTNNTCPIITQTHNCQGNGRPDGEYEYWRWKPSRCDLPRFETKKFLELMRGKTLAFIGDSLARNQMESMLCILWQVEVPKTRANRILQRYYFNSTSTMIVRIWSSWLVHQTSERFEFAPEGIVKLHLDTPDKNVMKFFPNFDVIVISSGHWFTRQSDSSPPMKVNNIKAFEISVETILTSLVTHPNYTGLTILRSYSPAYYETGAWNFGGSCTGKVKPLVPGELVENNTTSVKHRKQVTGFDSAIKKKTNKSKLKLMDITEAFSYRHDGHPGPYTKRGPDGRPTSLDCLHWCLPGPVDTWNELLLEIIQREIDLKYQVA
ncbi:hypothetical protein K2173_026698 [Erythroxylum novogranatense]|uniref:Trichome birefringence-like N-terminal domain-containing protein n=1 Tax=Erythroxylum novogranatense TaxID=1862640 RepID=A0AAV8TWY8_9ROSI|nr:hypothetical protein K2173_026698 [Erythroxylum novogranatense]